MRDEARYRATTRMVCAQDLSEKHPERDQWGVNAVLPYSIYRIHCLPNEVIGQYIAEWQRAILQVLPPEKSGLLTQPSLVRKIASVGLLAEDGSLLNTI